MCFFLYSSSMLTSNLSWHRLCSCLEADQCYFQRSSIQRMGRPSDTGGFPWPAVTGSNRIIPWLKTSLCSRPRSRKMARSKDYLVFSEGTSTSYTTICLSSFSTEGNRSPASSPRSVLSPLAELACSTAAFLCAGGSFCSASGQGLL